MIITVFNLNELSLAETFSSLSIAFHASKELVPDVHHLVIECQSTLYLLMH